MLPHGIRPVKTDNQVESAKCADGPASYRSLKGRRILSFDPLPKDVSLAYSATFSAMPSLTTCSVLWRTAWHSFAEVCDDGNGLTVAVLDYVHRTTSSREAPNGMPSPLLPCLGSHQDAKPWRANHHSPLTIRVMASRITSSTPLLQAPDSGIPLDPM